MNDLAIGIKLLLWLIGAAFSLSGAALILFYPGTIIALGGFVLFVAGIVLCRKLTDAR